MIYQLSDTVRAWFDPEVRAIRVQETHGNPVYLPLWLDSAFISTLDDWNKSKYSKLVGNEEFNEALAWWWVDIGQVK